MNQDCRQTCMCAFRVRSAMTVNAWRRVNLRLTSWVGLVSLCCTFQTAAKCKRVFVRVYGREKKKRARLIEEVKESGLLFVLMSCECVCSVTCSWKAAAARTNGYDKIHTEECTHWHTHTHAWGSIYTALTVRERKLFVKQKHTLKILI